MNAGTAPSALIQDKTDVLVTGAGPAGLACAIAAASQGLRVRVVDAAGPGIDKACGEGLMPDSLEALAALGFDLNHVFRHSETARLRGIRFLGDQISHPTSSPHLTTTEAAFPAAPGRGIRRIALHQLLLARAVTLGVRFHWHTPVRGLDRTSAGIEVRTSGAILHARYLIGADGHQSRIAHWANLSQGTVHSRRIGLRQHYAIAPWTDFVEVYWSDYGQAYVTPISSTRVCVAFVFKHKFPGPAAALQHFPALEHRLAAAVPSGAPRGSITLGRTLRRVTTGNIALLGDASGSVDAITGEGMSLCFRQALALSLALKGDDLASYQQAHRRIQRLPTLMSRTLLLMDRSPRLRARAFNTFERNPGLFARLLRLHIGHSPLQLLGFDGLLATGLHILKS